MTIVWTLMISLMVKLVMKLIPDGGAIPGDPSEPLYLDNNLISQPAAALQLVDRESLHCSELVRGILEDISEGVRTEKPEYLERVRTQAGNVHRLSMRISDYMAELFAAGSLTEGQANKTARIMYILSDIDRIAVFSVDLSNSIQDKIDRKLKFSREAMEELAQSLQIIRKMYGEIIQVMKSGRREKTTEILCRKGRLLELDSIMRRNHMSRVAQGKCSVGLTVPFSQILHSIDRMGNSCANLAETVSSQIDLKYFIFDERGAGNQP